MEHGKNVMRYMGDRRSEVPKVSTMGYAQRLSKATHICVNDIGIKPYGPYRIKASRVELKRVRNVMI